MPEKPFLPLRSSKEQPKLVSQKQRYLFPDILAKGISRMADPKHVRKHKIENYVLNCELCPDDLRLGDHSINLTAWLQEAIKKGCFSISDWDGYPDKIYYMDNKGRFFEAIKGYAPGCYHGWEAKGWSDKFEKSITKRLKG